MQEIVGDLPLDFCAHTEPGTEGISWRQRKLGPATESSSNDNMGITISSSELFPILLTKKNVHLCCTVLDPSLLFA